MFNLSVSSATKTPPGIGKLSYFSSFFLSFESNLYFSFFFFFFPSAHFEFLFFFALGGSPLVSGKQSFFRILRFFPLLVQRQDHAADVAGGQSQN
jgi:hypothetical protein